MPNEPHQRNYLLGSFETPSTIPPTNPTKTKPLTPKESKNLCLTNMLRLIARRLKTTGRHSHDARRHGIKTECRQPSCQLIAKQLSNLAPKL